MMRRLIFSCLILQSLNLTHLNLKKLKIGNKKGDLENLNLFFENIYYIFNLEIERIKW